MQKFLKDPVAFGLSQVDKNLLDNMDKKIASFLLYPKIYLT